MFAHKLFCPQLNLLQYTCSLAQDGCRAMLKEVQHKKSLMTTETIQASR